MPKLIPAAELIRIFQKMYQEHWPYEWGKAERGCVDCSGAFVYAYKQFGQSIAHGANAIARQHIKGNLLPACQAKPGMAAIKLRTPNEEGYDLPDKYRQGGSAYDGNLNDYYHIGLVDTDPNYILNAKSTQAGFSRDKIWNGWDCVAYLAKVDYQDEGDSEMEEVKAVVALPAGASGSTVNLRASASKSAKIIRRVPVGTTVKVLTDQEFWCEIEVDGVSGWMMANYLEYAGQEGESGGDVPDNVRAQLAEALDKISTAVEAIREAVDSMDKIVAEG